MQHGRHIQEVLLLQRRCTTLSVVENVAKLLDISLSNNQTILQWSPWRTTMEHWW